MREMKDSGIEWIGKIPVHWKVSTIKNEYIFQTGGTPKTEIDDYFEGKNVWINISDMKHKILYDSVKHISDDAIKNTSMSISPKGSLLYAFKLSVGAVSFCGKDMYTNEAIATFLPCKNSLDYLYYIAPIFIIMNANENIYGAKLLNQQLIRNAKIIIPPISEQQKLSAYLDTKCTKIDTIIEKQQKIIEKLKAYKLSLITETVTKGLNPDVKVKDSGIEWIGKIPEHWST
ncbi:MAG: restriction endonuclease subunit S, partial [Ruminococcus sp.]|nr:restriction endonuclease subunit S [Ruminococcus sp.]